MAAQLSTKLTLDGTQHNAGLREATKELSQYKREVKAADRELKQLQAQSRTATGAISAFATSMKSGNVNGMLISGASAAKMFSKSLMGIAGIAGAGIGLGSWLSDAVQEGTRLAQEGEGIRLAFERLNQPGLLENLRKETHNTVTDIELMKQAVKFDDFNLDTNELGTYLAFAQQKAKDTGQSVDFLVDSIVTGLGRKSLPILDNLGLSAAEIKKVMGANGDMTKAVAEIIKKKMSEAGEYVETAADRAMQKETAYKNELVKLGETFAPLTETAGAFFNDLQRWAMQAINAMRPLLDMLTVAGRQRKEFDSMGGNDKLARMTKSLNSSANKKGMFNAQVKEFDRYIGKLEEAQKVLDRWQKGERNAALQGQRASLTDTYGADADRTVRARLRAAKQMKDAYQRSAQTILNPPTKTDTTDTTKKTKSGSKKKTYAEGSIGWLEDQIKKLEEKIKMSVDASQIKKLREEIVDLQKMKAALENPLEVKLPDIPVEYEQLTKNIQKVVDAYNIGVVGEQKAKELIDGMNGQIKSLGLKPIKVKIDTDVIREAKELTDQINDVIEAYNIGAVGYDKANELIAAINKQLKDIGLRPVNVKLDTEAVKDARVLQENIQGILQDYDMGIIGADKARELVDGINKELAKLGIRPVNVEIESDAARTANDIRAKIDAVMQEYDLGAIGYDKAKELIDGFNAQLESKGLRPVNVQLDTKAVQQARDLKSNIDRIVEMHDMGAIGTSKARELVAAINKEIKSLGLEPIKVDIEPKGLTKMKDLNSDVSTFIGGFEGIDNVKNSIEGLVDSFSEGASAWDMFMGVMQTGQSILQAVESAMAAVNVVQELLGTTATTTATETAAAGATEMATAAGVTTAKSGEAVASATAEGAKMPFPLNIVAIAMGVAAVIAALGMITGAFAGGGIVGGSSFSGDKLYARVNSGEMILNGRQQRNLFNAINSGNIGGNSGINGDVQFTIKGRKLVGVLRNENDKMKKIR